MVKKRFYIANLNSSCGKMKYRLAPRFFHFIQKEDHNEEFVFSILMGFELGNCRCEMNVRKGLVVFVLLNACALCCNLRSCKQRKTQF